MSRNLTAAAITEIISQKMTPVLFVQMLFSSGNIYVWSGTYPIIATMPGGASQTWVGLGNLGTIGAIGETADVAASGVSFMLSGIPASLITSALGEVRQGNPVLIWQGFLTAAGGIVVSPYQAWAGRMDTCAIRETADLAAITITAENRLIDLQKSRERRYEKQDHAIEFAGDLGFDYVPSLQELSVVWGKKNVPLTSGQGSGCFSANTMMHVHRLLPCSNGGSYFDLVIPFEILKAGDLVWTARGTWRPVERVAVHDFRGMLLDMGHQELVTRDHPIQVGAGWHPAEVRFREEAFYDGKIYNAEVKADDDGSAADTEHSYTLASGLVCHNKLNQKV
jgi:hypothetical protein